MNLDINLPPIDGGSPACLRPEAEIPIFEQLLIRHPEAFALIPLTFPRQETAREVIKPGNRNHWVGLFSSRLNRALVPFESGLERQAFCIWETHPLITSYRSQPYTIELRIDGRTRVVCPDAELTTGKGTALIEIKPAVQAAKLRNQGRFEALQAWAALRGMRFAVLTEQGILGQRLISATWLLSLTRGLCDQRLREAVWEWLSSNPELSFRRALTLTTRYPAVHSAICELVLDGYITVDLDLPLENQPLALSKSLGD